MSVVRRFSAKAAASTLLEKAKKLCDIGVSRPPHTLAREVSCTGVGLHSGDTATVKLLPASIEEGRYFVHTAGPTGNVVASSIRHIPAMLAHVVDTRLNTTLEGPGGARIGTVEHLLSALEGMGIDSVRIEVEGGAEIPVLDGSSRPWVEAIEDAGVSMAESRGGSHTRGGGGEEDDKAMHRPWPLSRPMSVQEGDSFIMAFPAAEPRLTYGIDFPHLPAVGRQWFTWCPADGGGYRELVAPARTFGILEQVEQLKAAGLIKGGSLDNALVCSVNGGWVNPPLRFSDEPCRHKLLDLIGDLALCAEPGWGGVPLAHIVAFKASHSLHAKFGLALLELRRGTLPVK